MALTGIERYYVAQYMKRPKMTVAQRLEEKLNDAIEKIKRLEEERDEARLLAEICRDKLNLMMDISHEVIVHNYDLLPWEE